MRHADLLLYRRNRILYCLVVIVI